MLEAEHSTQLGPAASGSHPCRSSRESKGHRRAKRKALDDNLLCCLHVLDVEWCAIQRPSTGAEALERVSWRAQSKPTRGSPELELAMVAVQESSAIGIMGELTPAPDTFKDAVAWPWAGIGKVDMSAMAAHQFSQGIGPQLPQVPPGLPMGWIPPYPQALLGITPGVGIWSYASVSDTGYDSVPLKALSFGDYSMPLGDHLTPATKEII